MAELRTQISARRRHAVLAVAIGAIALDTALLGLIAPLLPAIERRIGATDAELGIALGAYALPILFVSLPLGRLSDTIGRRPLLLGGLLLTVVGSIAIAFAPSLPLLVLGRAIQGVGSAASWIAALALVSELAPPGRKGESIGYALAANSVGAIAGPALGGILGDTAGFALPFLLVAVLGGGLAAAGWYALPNDVRPAVAGTTTPRDLLRLATSRAVLPATAIVIAASAALGVVEVVAPLDADDRLGLSAATIGALFAATVALDAIAAPIGGRASDRRGRGFVSLAGLGLVIVSMAMLALLGGVAGFVAGLCHLRHRLEHHVRRCRAVARRRVRLGRSRLRLRLPQPDLFGRLHGRADRGRRRARDLRRRPGLRPAGGGADRRRGACVLPPSRAATGVGVSSAPTAGTRQRQIEPSAAQV